MTSQTDPQTTTATLSTPILTSIPTAAQLTFCLAYLHHYKPKRTHFRNLFAVDHLRTLTRWLGQPDPRLTRLHHHPTLVTALTLLEVAGLAQTTAAAMYLTPQARAWLHANPAEQAAQLSTAVEDTQRWQATLEHLKLTPHFPPDRTAYLQQQLARRRRQPPDQPASAACWQTVEDHSAQLAVPWTLPTGLLFDLLQIGRWHPNTTQDPLAGQLYLDANSIARAVQNNTPPTAIHWILETATQAALPESVAEIVAGGTRSASSHAVRPLYLLTTAQDHQLAALLGHKRLRRHFIEQFSPRSAAIQPAAIPQIEQWLAKHHILLNKPADFHPATPEPDLAASWLCLRIAVLLNQLMPLPFPPPHAQLDALTAGLSPFDQAALDALAHQTIAGLRDLINGRDAFFPAHSAPSPDLLARIDRAIGAESQLTILYQTPAENAPRLRRIQPLRRSQQGSLHYLHAYCYLTEATRTFRLDRIHHLEE